ncbi:TlpA family protein disulfide reductase [Alphaproteobacteria bacterium]|nr:TlpA family protein disulfide reductase [Alphaproteobacteria bacterium]
MKFNPISLFIIFIFFIILIVSFIFLDFGKTTKVSDSPNLKGEVIKFKANNSPRKTNKIFWEKIDGNKDRIKNYNGKVVLMNFWATWCVPCIEELPAIDKLKKIFDEDKFEVVAINLDSGDKSKAENLLTKLKIKNIELFFDSNNYLADFLDVSVIPTTIIFGKKGIEKGRIFGNINWTKREAVELINFYINAIE